MSASALSPLRDRVRRPGRAAVLAGAIGGVLLVAYVVVATFALQFTTRMAWDEHGPVFGTQGGSVWALENGRWSELAQDLPPILSVELG